MRFVMQLVLILVFFSMLFTTYQIYLQKVATREALVQKQTPQADGTISFIVEDEKSYEEKKSPG